MSSSRMSWNAFDDAVPVMFSTTAPVKLERPYPAPSFMRPVQIPLPPLQMQPVPYNGQFQNPAQLNTNFDGVVPR